MPTRPLPIQDNDEHLPPHAFSDLFDDDPLDIDAYALVSEGSHPLPQEVIDGAARVARMAEEQRRTPTMMDTVVAVMLSIPGARHFEDADGFAWLAELKKVALTEICLFATCFHCTPTQALKTLLVERVFSEKEAKIDPASILTVVRTLGEHTTDKAIWQSLVRLSIDPHDVHTIMTRYQLAGYEPAVRAVIALRALRFEGISLPTSSALAQIARPHDFSVRG